MIDLRKPKDREGKVTLAPRQRKAKLDALCASQGGRCAYCACRMTRELYRMRTATLEHITPQPAGCAKDDRDQNLLAVCFACNARKGSKRT